MRDFVRDGMLHWQQDEDSPCGSRPWIKLGEGTTLFGWKPPPEPLFPKDCPVCIPTRAAYFKMVKNGGVQYGRWDFRPNEDK